MTSSPLMQQFESGDSLLLKAIRFLVLAGGTLLLGYTAILELDWPQQILLGILTVVVIFWLDRSSGSYLVTLTLLLVSVFSTFRYGYWRYHTTAGFLLAHGFKTRPVDVIFTLLLLFAETYAFLTLCLGYLQTLWPLRRTPVDMPDDLNDWPEIDLLIPTFNEPLSLVKFTILAAVNIDWPADKLHVHLLDDGNREEFRLFAEELGIGYMTREDNLHAKAGNINNALARTKAPFVVLFDCDHVPTRSFLQITLGWLLRDSKLGMLQTPHRFYSPDPFERNLNQFRLVPNEGDYFYSVVQDGNDFWNSTFFCGSCAVLRRAALDDIGGIATETVTEDAHTSLRMQSQGWSTAYINIPQAAGLSTDRLSGHVKQRIRWARGMIQIMRIDNPLFARGLTFAQRLCYFNAMTHFLYALPRLIFLTAPIIYLVLGHVNMIGYWATILAYAFPHLALANIANSRIQGHHRFSFWNEIYETVLAPYLLLPTIGAFFNPRAGKFNVTSKNRTISRGFFDGRTALPFLFLIAVNLLAILCAIPRLVQISSADRSFPMNFLANMYDGHHVGVVVMNLLWAAFNLVILGVATSVAWESRQRRLSVRIAMTVPADVQLANGPIFRGVTSDVSTGGLMIRMEQNLTADPGDAISVTLPVFSGRATLPATVVEVSNNILRAKYDPLTIEQEEALAIVLFSRADTWLGWGEANEADRPLTSLGRIFRLAFRGLARSLQATRPPQPRLRAGKLATSIAPLLLLMVLFTARPLAGQQSPSPIPKPSAQIAFAQEIPVVSATAPDQGDVASTQPSLPDDLSLLPAPFYNRQTDLQPTIPIVFLVQPSAKALQAAGIVASWFGTLATTHPVRFPIFIGEIPNRNAVVIAERASILPASLQLAATQPTLAIRTNPADSTSKLLIFAADSPDNLLTAATALTQRVNLQGDTVRPTQTLVAPASSEATDPQNPTTLPNLELFAQSGYPFTRKSDLADTAIVLPDNPSTNEIELYLALMARFGAQTGYPVFNVSVTNVEGITPQSRKDYLVLGTGTDQPAISVLNPTLPVSVDGSGFHIQDTQGLFPQLQHAWWKVHSFDRVQLSQLQTAAGSPTALIEATEWPRHSNRSVIVILLHNQDAIPGFLSAFLSPSQSGITQSVSVFDGKHFTSYRIGDNLYRVGSISWRRYPNMVLQEYPPLMVFLTLTSCILMAIVLRSTLRRKARFRLQGND
ncbi:MAG TPA: UDP-forming cellulose synthase catalytic subunit [Edaphobacter sp.]|nr:UDP-forming cellulose synthase catalytic subunit [Edaphobacter sp.]